MWAALFHTYWDWVSVLMLMVLERIIYFVFALRMFLPDDECIEAFHMVGFQASRQKHAGHATFRPIIHGTPNTHDG